MISKSRVALSLGIGLVGVLGMSGCLPDEDFSDVTIKTPSPKVALPLFNTTITVENMLKADKESGALRKNPDQSYSLLYQNSIQSEPLKDYFPALSDQEFSESFSLGIDAPFFNMTDAPPVAFEGTIPFALDDFDVYTIESSDGVMNLQFDSDYEHDLSIEATFPNIITPQGDTLVLNFYLPAWGSTGNSQWEDNLANYQINLSSGNVEFRLEVKITGSGQPISANEKIDFQFSINDLDFNYLSGNFNNIQIPIKADTMAIQALSGVIDGNLAVNPILSLDFTNSFGAPISPDFSKLYIKHTKGSSVRLKDAPGYEFFDGNYQLPYPKERSEVTASDSHDINDQTSNIDDAFASIPSGFIYNFGFLLNSGENDTTFITSDSQIGVDMGLELPLEAGFNLTLQDSIEVSFDELEDVKELKLLIKTENDFPIDANLQVYFLNEKGEVIKDGAGDAIKLFDQEDKFLVAAELVNSSTGETLPANVDLPITATINQDKFEKIREATHFLVRANLNSMSDEDRNRIRLYSFYSIRFSIATQIQASFDS
uniref:Uncharacterized protein n=1 Tax=Roseihalotalea indica TaxID=2867963 RepID=A0AA49GGW3_9BACT|nr:hypothetical protein K4G66_18345 [Tunicatimonas sp. TK19036]